MSESYRDVLRDLVKAQRETALATIVLAENVAALRQTIIEAHADTVKAAERMTRAVEGPTPP